jgi:hypothetical protein
MGTRRGGAVVADDGFSEVYSNLLYGSYNCVDRIVLNAYYPLGLAGRVLHVVAAAARPRRAAGQCT